jgi:ribonuclease PH
MAKPSPAPTTRLDDRASDALRPLSFERGLQRHAAGSVLVRWGHTHVLCAVNFEDRVPPHRMGSGGGWLTAEYSMLPGSTHGRVRRDRSATSGRTAEIQRLIGRSLRAAVDLDKLGARTVHIDCDVIQADGGTRCASITGAWVALALALAAEGRTMRALPPPVAGVSIGILGSRVLCDLDYSEDSHADVDLNFVATPAGIVEVQGSAEGAVFARAQLDAMLNVGEAACAQIFALQRQAVLDAGVMP